jgi:hypothetical protein
MMLSAECLREFQRDWLPHITTTGLDRLIDLLQKGSPFLIHGSFGRAVPMGCLATHIAWHHPHTADLTQEAGIAWLNHIAGLNPATSLVIREWDRRGACDWEMRTELLAVLAAERDRRQAPVAHAPVSPAQPVEVPELLEVTP